MQSILTRVISLQLVSFKDAFRTNDVTSQTISYR